MTFRLGQRVICIKPSCKKDEPPPYVRYRQEYTVKSIQIEPSRDGPVVTITVYELPVVKVRGWTYGYCINHFRPVKTKKTDISIFTKMLRKADA